MDLSGERPWWPLGDLDQMGEAVRFWIGRNFSPELTVREWWHRLADAGLTAATWPRAHGGIAATTVIQRVIEHELATARTVAPPVDNLGFRVVGPALRQFGTTTQLDEWLVPLLCGETAWTLLIDDPGVDDPLQTACTVSVDWKWVEVSGSKRRTERTIPTHAVLLGRSSAAGKAGLTMVAIDLSVDGVHVGDDEIRFEGARVPREHVVGNVDAGWPVWVGARPYLERSLAGRIRRGLVRVPPGAAAGQLDRTVGEVVANYTPPPAPEHDRRGG
jgi:alkylation response protein AidB-like acyl-CoA dehydrogenase